MVGSLDVHCVGIGDKCDAAGWKDGGCAKICRVRSAPLSDLETLITVCS